MHKVEMEHYKPIFEMLLKRIRKQILVNKDTVIVPENLKGKVEPSKKTSGRVMEADHGNG